MWLSLPLLLACSDGSNVDADARLYTEQLAQIETAKSSPKGDREEALISALGGCQAIQSKDWRGDCALAAVQGLAAKTRHETSALLQMCDELPSELTRAECAFQIGEQRNDRAACAQAGPFAEDCRMHIYSAAFTRLKAVPDAEIEAAFDALALEFGFSTDDPRPWVAASRWLLGRTSPLDRHRCDDLTVTSKIDRVKVCHVAGRQLYMDRLNHARDTNQYPCDGSPLPDDLKTGDDSELDQLRLERERRDLCP